MKGQDNPHRGKTPARYDEGTLATHHNAAKGERGYHSDMRPRLVDEAARGIMSPTSLPRLMSPTGAEPPTPNVSNGGLPRLER